MWKPKYLTKKLAEWLRSHDDSDVPFEGVDDPHDNADPQRVTYIYGGNVEEGKWT